MTAMAHSFSSALLHFLWQGVAVAFLLWIGLYLLRRRSAASRYAACCAAMALMTLVPAVTAWLIYDQPAVAAPVVAGPTVSQAALAASPVRIPTLWITTLETWVLPVWSIGVLLLSFRLVWGCMQISRMRRRAALPDEALRALVARLAQRLGIGKRVGVLIARDGESPSVVGWIRPVVLVSASALLGLTPDQLEAVLAHELAHIRRHDYLVNILQVILETLLFYHPAVWWVSARMRHERELCCDDLAVGCCGDVVCYARALTKLERLRITAPAMAMASNSGSMVYRVQRLLGGGAQEYVPSKLPGILALALGLVCFGLNIHSAHSQEPKPKQFWFRVSPGSDAGVTIDLGGATLASQEGRIEYPGFARERGIDGTVTAELTLNGEAAVIDAHVVSGPSELRKYVLQGVLGWRFTQAHANAVLYINVKFDHASAAVPPANQQQRGYAVTFGGGTAQVTGPVELTPEQNAEREREMAELDAKIAEFKRQNQGQLPEAKQTATGVGAAQANAEIIRDREYALLLQQQQTLRAQAELEQGGQRNNGPLQEGASFQLERIQQVEGAIMDLQNKLASEGADGAEQARRQLQERQAELVQLQMALANASDMTAESLAGRRLKSIHIFGQVEASVLTQLGVGVGDTLTQESMAAAASTARQIDPRLEVQFMPTENSQAEMRIIGPGGAK